MVTIHNFVCVQCIGYTLYSVCTCVDDIDNNYKDIADDSYV